MANRTFTTNGKLLEGISNYGDLPTHKYIPFTMCKPRKIITLRGHVTGDAGGGSVYEELTIGANYGHHYYYAISRLELPSNNTAAEGHVIYLESDRWLQTFTSVANILTYAYDAAKAANLRLPHVQNKSQQVSLKSLIYLGRPRDTDANPGVITIDHGSNTNLIEYHMNIDIIQYEEELPL